MAPCDDALGEPPATSSGTGARKPALANSAMNGGGFSTASEDTSATGFEGPDAGFMVNWPFVWPRANADAGAWTSRCPTTTAGRSTRGSTRTAVGAALRRDQPRRRRLQQAHVDLAYAGHGVHHHDGEPGVLLRDQRQPGVDTAVYDDPDVQKAFPMAP